MLRLKVLAVALVAISAFVATVHAADPQQPVGREPLSTRRTDMNPKVTTYNHGAGSAEANTVISQGYRINDTISISGQYSHDMKGVIGNQQYARLDNGQFRQSGQRQWHGFF